MPLNSMKGKKNVPSTGHRALKFHNSKEIHRRITQDVPSNSFSKDNEKSQPQLQKKERPSIIDSGDENLTFIPEVDYFCSHFKTACFFVMLG